VSHGDTPRDTVVSVTRDDEDGCSVRPTVSRRDEASQTTL
jgi:hypothetical protein